jgi:AbiV family abortive infection protein
MDFFSAIKICKKNGERLLEDAEYLYDFERYASAYGLAKLAQEEFAKGFILKIVKSGGLKWSKEVRRSLNHHVSKQLMAIILEFLNPDTDEFLKMIKNRSSFKRPEKVSDAMNIYVHEILKKWESKNWFWLEDPKYVPEAKSILAGKEDKIKQNAFYVEISKQGQAIDFTSRFKKKVVEKEIEKARRYSQFINENEDFRFKKIVEIFSILSKKSSNNY